MFKRMAKKAVQSVGEALTQNNPIDEDNDDTVDILIKICGGLVLFGLGYAIGHATGSRKPSTILVLK